MMLIFLILLFFIKLPKGVQCLVFSDTLHPSMTKCMIIGQRDRFEHYRNSTWEIEVRLGNKLVCFSKIAIFVYNTL